MADEVVAQLTNADVQQLVDSAGLSINAACATLFLLFGAQQGATCAARMVDAALAAAIAKVTENQLHPNAPTSFTTQ